MANSHRCVWPDCGKILGRLSSLQRHVAETHKQKWDQLTCEECQKTFWRKEYLDRHLRAHRGLGRQRCDICLRSFRSDYLAEHKTGCARRSNIRLEKSHDERPSVADFKNATRDSTAKPIRLKWGGRPFRPPLDSDDDAPSLHSQPPKQLQMVPSVYSHEYLEQQHLLAQCHADMSAPLSQHATQGQVMSESEGTAHDTSSQLPSSALNSTSGGKLPSLALSNTSGDSLPQLQPFTTQDYQAAENSERHGREALDLYIAEIKHHATNQRYIQWEEYEFAMA